MMLHNKILNVEEVRRLSEISSIDQPRSELAGILSLVGGQKTRSLLSSHQQTLLTNLQQYAKQCQEEGGVCAPSSSTDSSSGSS